MATKHAIRLVQHRFCSSGKVLREEGKAVEYVFIKKMEQERFEGKQGPKGEETRGSSSTSGLYNSLVRVGKAVGIGFLQLASGCRFDLRTRKFDLPHGYFEHRRNF